MGRRHPFSISETKKALVNFVKETRKKFRYVSVWLWVLTIAVMILIFLNGPEKLGGPNIVIITGFIIVTI